MLMKVFRLGADWQHEERNRETKINKTPALYFLVKDHKQYDPARGPPPTRPVAAAINGMNVHLSEIISDVLEPVAAARDDSAEVISTDDLLSKVDEYNNKLVPGMNMGDMTEGIVERIGMEEKAEAALKDGRQLDDDEIVVVGADADALYPSLDEAMSSKIAKKSVMESKVKIKGVNYKEAARYVALNSSESEVRFSGLRRILPWRRYRKGTRPGVTGPGPTGPSTDDEEQWTFPRVELTEMVKTKLVATVVEIGVKTVFRTHVYQFGGRYYHQQRGGPIGLRATGAIAKIVMAEWDAQMLRILTDNDISYEMAVRYVDDIRMILRAIKRGYRWNGRHLEYKE